MYFSVIVPIYNEEELLEESIKKYLKDCKKISNQFEIIIVNDGSTDKSIDICNKLKSKFEEVRVLLHKKNLGVGKAIVNGFKQAKGDWMFVDPIDQPFKITDIKKFLPLFLDNDLIVVVRTDRSANSIFRKLTSIINYLLIKILFRIDIHDFQFVQFYKRTYIKNVNIISTDTFVPPELIIRAKLSGSKIAEVKTKFYKRTKGNSKYYSLSRYYRTIKEMLVFWYKLNIIKSI